MAQFIDKEKALIQEAQFYFCHGVIKEKSFYLVHDEIGFTFSKLMSTFREGVNNAAKYIELKHFAIIIMQMLKIYRKGLQGLLYIEKI